MDVEGGNTFEETVKHTEIDHRSMEANPFDPPDPPRVSNILNTNTLLPSAVSDAISAMAHNFYGVQGAAAAIGGSPGPGWPQAIASFGHSRQNPGLPSAIEGILEVSNRGAAASARSIPDPRRNGSRHVYIARFTEYQQQLSRKDLLHEQSVADPRKPAQVTNTVEGQKCADCSVKEGAAPDGSLPEETPVHTQIGATWQLPPSEHPHNRVVTAFTTATRDNIHSESQGHHTQMNSQAQHASQIAALKALIGQSGVGYPFGVPQHGLFAGTGVGAGVGSGAGTSPGCGNDSVQPMDFRRMAHLAQQQHFLAPQPPFAVVPWRRTDFMQMPLHGPVLEPSQPLPAQVSVPALNTVNQSNKISSVSARKDRDLQLHGMGGDVLPMVVAADDVAQKSQQEIGPDEVSMIFPPGTVANPDDDPSIRTVHALVTNSASVQSTEKAGLLETVDGESPATVS